MAALVPVAAATAGLVLCSTMVLRTSEALFSATTGTPSQSWQTGSVAISDDDGGTATFDTAVDGLLTGGQQLQKCITVTYSGSLASSASVELYGTSSGTLAPYLNLAIDRGTGTCGAFTVQQALFSGTLSGFGAAATDYDTGVGPWAPGTTGASTLYRFTVTVQNVAAAQSKSAAGTFTWEARG
jgi:hypothetical protein